jgi:amidase
MADTEGSSSSPPNTTDWQTQAAKKREQCLNLIPSSWRLDATLLDTLRTPLQDHANNVIQLPRICGILSVEELHITDDYDVAALLSALASGKLSSVAVTTAFAKRAAIAQQLVRVLGRTLSC